MDPVSPSRTALRALAEPSGAELMERVAAGDTQAFAALVARYQRPVLNAVYRSTGNRSTAEELTQDVFVKVYNARASYQATARFETWLYRIVFNLCANQVEYRRRRRAASLDAPEFGDEAPASRALADAGAEAPDAGLERRELRERVRGAIARLPDAQRAALILSRFENLPYQEIAAVLETSVEAIKSLLFRARDNLRAALAPEFGEEAGDEL